MMHIKLDTKYLKSILLYVIAALLSILAIVYLCYHLFGTADDSIATEVAQSVRYTDDLVLDGYLFKSEHILYTDKQGSINHLYADGVKVATDSAVAAVYSSAHSASHETLAKIDAQLEILEKSNKTSYTKSDIQYVDSEISKWYYLIREKTEAGAAEYIEAQKSNFLIYLNQREIIKNKRLNFNLEIAALQTQREQLLSNEAEDIIGTVYADCAGSYYAEVDGYEKIFDAAKIGTLTVSGFSELTAMGAETFSGTQQGTACGKLMTDYVWYLGCKINKTLSDNFTEGNRYTVSFPQSSDEAIHMELFRIAGDPSEDEILLIFKSTVTPSHFTFERCQTVRIAQTAAEGYRVPVSAVRIADGETGVYVLKGNTIYFKKIEILLEKDGYYIVEKNDKDAEERAQWLELFDRIVIIGKNLYDGKVIGS